MTICRGAKPGFACGGSSSTNQQPAIPPFQDQVRLQSDTLNIAYLDSDGVLNRLPLEVLERGTGEMGRVWV